MVAGVRGLRALRWKGKGGPKTKGIRNLETHPLHSFIQSQPSWIEIVNKKLKFPPPLLSAIQEGRLGLVQQLLESGVEVTGGRPGLPLWNVEEAKDCSRTARLGYEAITDVLLASVKFDFQKIHEALLVVVDTNQPAVVRRLMEREKGRKVDTRSFSLAFFGSSIDGACFVPGVTPLPLACQKDLYEIAQLLMDQRHTIAQSHPRLLYLPRVQQCLPL